MGFMDAKYAKVREEANLKTFLTKNEINENGRELRKVESKKEKTAEDEKKIRQLRQNTERLALQQQQAQQLVQKASLGEKILKCYFAYKMAALLCDTFIAATHDHRRGIGEGLVVRLEDIPEARAEQIEQMRDQFDEINQEAKQMGIVQDDIFTQQDKDHMTDLAAISRDHENPQQGELYASKCEEMGLDRGEALQAFEQDKSIDTLTREPEQQGIEMER